MIVVLTGGAGFIGLNAMRRFLAFPDCKIRILDNFSSSSPERIKQVVAAHSNRVEVQRGDICDENAVREVVKGADAVIHLAAQTGVASSIADPARDLETNIAGTFNVLDACRRANVRRVVMASSAATIGNVPPPQREDLPARPVSPYGASKAAGEAYCSAFYRSFGLETIALRFSNVYGPLSWNKGSVVAHFAKRAIAGKPLVVNGDGTQTRDFLQVEDLADVIAYAAHAPLGADVLGAPCNVATGIQTRIIDLAQMFKTLLNDRRRDCKIEYGPPLVGEVLVSAPAIDRIKAIFPAVSFRTLLDGLPGTLDWFLTRADVGL